MRVTIYHNPRCGTSRGALEIIRARGIEPKIVEYLKTPLTRGELVALATKMKAPVREMVRAKEPLYAELKLDGADDARLLDAMAQHPRREQYILSPPDICQSVQTPGSPSLSSQ
jgi:arsenate reductase